MKIAIATDDKESVSRFTGRAAWFCITEINDGKIGHKDFKPHRSPHHEGAHDHSHHHDHSQNPHQHSIELLQDVDVFLVQHLGPHFVEALKSSPVKIVKTREESIDAALTAYLQQQIS